MVGVVVGIPLLAGVFFLALAYDMHSQGGLSSDAQGHGVRRTAVIQSVHNIGHTSSYSVGTGASKHTQTSTSYTAEVIVRLSTPVDGRTQTTVHVPEYESSGPGDTLTVLVSPKDPSYAELPGSPITPAGHPMIFEVVGFVFVFIAVLGSLLVVRAFVAARR
jgi:hypothetical protein